MMLGDTNRGIDLSFFHANPSWDVIDSYWTADIDTYESSITFVIQLQRKSLFVVLNVVMPIILLSVLNIFTFALPSEGGEKASYAVTIFLAFAVFLTIIETTLPDNSDSVAMFSIYIVLMTCMSTFITVLTLIGCRICAWEESEHPIPSCLKGMTRFIQCVLCRSRRRNMVVDIQPPIKPSKDTKKGVKNGKAFTKRMESNDAVFIAEEPDMEEDYTWKKVVRASDVLFFVFFTLLAVLGNISFLLIASQN